MSEENRPNLNAVGLATDIIIALEKRLRGPAAKAGMKQVLPLVADGITGLVELIDGVLDDNFGRV
jgi:hypothetical protein